MDVVHKILATLVAPLTLYLIGMISSVLLRKRGKRFSSLLFSFSLLWIWIWSTPILTRLLGVPLEKECPPCLVEGVVNADAICLLGGGMAVNTNVWAYAEMNSSADRVLHASRIWKAGKAGWITISGYDATMSTMPFLKSLGVKDEAVIPFESAKNTEEEAKMISKWIKSRKGVDLDEKPKILLVTSAWHMRRARFLFEREGLNVVPVGCDYEATMRYQGRRLTWYDWIPQADCLGQNTYLLKEHFAYWCYRLLHWISG